MTRNFVLSILCVILFGFQAMGQKGSIRGSVFDKETGEALFGVNAVIKGTTVGAVTDFDGKFDIKADPGTYTLQFSFISYQTVTVQEVVVKAGDVTTLDNIALGADVAQMGEVVVTAKAIRTTEEALLTVKKKSPNVMDGISAASFRKIGDSDAASAAKRVTGVSVEGGKYIYVRGLGDRYTKTMLNNVDIPGLDPDKNSIQIDIFPTNLIDNMMVLKTATAEMPADYTGGLVNIQTKDFPGERIFDVSVGVGYNPSMHFNDDYLTYEGSSTDVLGFDNGLRALPEGARLDPVPSPVAGGYTEAEIGDFVSSFNPNLGAQTATSMMDYNVGLSLGNQFALGDNKLGYIFSTTYKNTTNFYNDQLYGDYQLSDDAQTYEMTYANTREGSLGTRNILLGGLAGLAYKTKASKYRLTIMHLQNGEKQAGQFFVDDNGSAVGKSGYTSNEDNLEFSQRSLSNILFSGNHFTNDGKWEVDWRLSPTISRLSDPDIRKTAFTISGQGDPIFSAGAAGNPTRIWRDLSEINLVGRVDLTNKYDLFGNDAKLKFGASQTYKNRDYEILSYDVQFFGSQPDWSGNPDDVLVAENIYPNGNLYFSSGNPDPNPNEYNSSSQNTAAYISNEFSVVEDFKAILGLRGENYVQRHTGRNQQNTLSKDNEEVLSSFDLFPSANLIYSMSDNQNLRASYSRTIARPSFKELSFIQILDPLSNRRFNGSLLPVGDWDGNLESTRINNIDLRWEMFLEGNQLFSVSAFLKTFDKPIEIIRFSQVAAVTELQARNVGDGLVYGAEFEFRKSLNFIHESISNFNVSGNLTLVKSQIDMSDMEYNARKNFEKEGESIDRYRVMSGQAPYIINAGIGYQKNEIGLDAGLFYNVKGETLVVVSNGLNPDVFSEPFHSLNFNMNKRFGVEQNLSLGVKVSNILNDVREEFFQNFEADPQYYTRFSPGTSVSVNFGYNF
jgi:TonB-dependent receptor